MKGEWKFERHALHSSRDTRALSRSAIHRLDPEGGEGVILSTLFVVKDLRVDGDAEGLADDALQTDYLDSLTHPIRPTFFEHPCEESMKS